MKTVITAISIFVAAGLLSTSMALAAEKEHKHGKADKTPAAADAEEVKAQTTCPVMGGKINKDLYVDAQGKRIYVCCQGCISAVKKDPAKYIKKLEEGGVTLASVDEEGNVTECPVTKECPKGKCPMEDKND